MIDTEKQPIDETREEREARILRETQEATEQEKDAVDHMRTGMVRRYGPLVELLQSASIYLRNALVDAKNAERYNELAQIEYLIRRDASEALGVGIAMAMGVEMKKVGTTPSPIRDKAAGITERTK